MARHMDTIVCDGCGAEILGAPIVADHRDYCCRDCQEGRPCLCGERTDLDTDRRAHGAAGAEAPPDVGG